MINTRRVDALMVSLFVPKLRSEGVPHHTMDLLAEAAVGEHGAKDGVEAVEQDWVFTLELF